MKYNKYLLAFGQMPGLVWAARMKDVAALGELPGELGLRRVHTTTWFQRVNF